MIHSIGPVQSIVLRDFFRNAKCTDATTKKTINRYFSPIARHLSLALLVGCGELLSVPAILHSFSQRYAMFGVMSSRNKLVVVILIIRPLRKVLPSQRARDPSYAL